MSGAPGAESLLGELDGVYEMTAGATGVTFTGFASGCGRRFELRATSKSYLLFGLLIRVAMLRRIPRGGGQGETRRRHGGEKQVIMISGRARTSRNQLASVTFGTDARAVATL